MKVLCIGPMPPKVDGLADYTAGVMTAYESAGHVTRVIADGPIGLDDPRAVGQVTFSPVKFAVALRAVMRARPEVVHVQHTVATYGLRLLPLWALVLVARLRGARVLVTHHELTRDLIRLKWLGAGYYRTISRITDLAHVHTSDAARLAIDRVRLDAKDVVQHPHPIFPSVSDTVATTWLRRRHGLEECLVVLQLGFVQVEKGLRELVEGMAVLVARRPDLPMQLVVAGDVRSRPAGFAKFEQADRDYLSALTARIAELGLEGRVSFVGHVPEEEMGPWLETADLVALPYALVEQSGIANRAVAAGAPMLATRSGGLGALLGGLPGFESLDPYVMADALEEALTDLPRVRSVARATYAGLRAEGDPARLIDALVGPSSAGEVTHA